MYYAGWFHPGLFHDQVFVILDFVVDKHRYQKVRFECDDEFSRFRISDQCGDNDVGANYQFHSSCLRRLIINALASTPVYGTYEAKTSPFTAGIQPITSTPTRK